MTDETHQLLLMINNIVGMAVLFRGACWYVME